MVPLQVEVSTQRIVRPVFGGYPASPGTIPDPARKI